MYLPGVTHMDKTLPYTISCTPKVTPFLHPKKNCNLTVVYKKKKVITHFFKNIKTFTK
jgi:hypothetical protein